MDLRQTYSIVYESLCNLGFRSKNKQQLVDVADGLHINTSGTKQGLLNNIGKKLSEVIMMEYRALNFTDVNPLSLMTTMKLKNVPRKMEPMLKEIFTEVRKNIHKKKQKTKNNVNTAITGNPSKMAQSSPHANPTYSYSPIVQNYNFMYPNYPIPNYPSYPYYYPYNMMNYNPNDPSGYSTSMMNSMMNSMMPPLPQFNLPNQSNYLEPTQTQKEQKVPSQNVEALPQNEAPRKKNDKQVSQINQSVSNTNFIQHNSSSINNLIKNDQKSTPSKKKSPTEPSVDQKPKVIEIGDQEPQKPAPQINIKCICNNLFKGTSVACLHCPNYFHLHCLGMTKWSKQELQNFECPRCTIRKIDPVYQLKAIFLEEVVNFKTTHSFTRNLKVDNFIDEIDKQSYVIEVRSIRLDGINNYEISWPDYANLQFFEKLYEFKPLSTNSSVKKRKQETILIDKSRVVKTKIIPLKLQLKSTTRQMLKHNRIRDEGYFIIGIYLVKKMTANQLIDKICSSKLFQVTYEQSKNKIHNHFKINEDISLQKLTIKLTDPILLNRIKIPARGIFCQHPQCFSLDTFVHMMQKLNHRVWKCPICNYRCYGLYKDSYVASILEKAGPNNDEVEFYPDGTYTLMTVEEDYDEEEKPSKFVKKQIQEVIIDDDEGDDDLRIIIKKSNVFSNQKQYELVTQPTNKNSNLNSKELSPEKKKTEQPVEQIIHRETVEKHPIDKSPSIVDQILQDQINHSNKQSPENEIDKQIAHMLLLEKNNLLRPGNISQDERNSFQASPVKSFNFQENFLNDQK